MKDRNMYSPVVGKVWPAGRTYVRTARTLLALGPHFADP